MGLPTGPDNEGPCIGVGNLHANLFKALEGCFKEFIALSI